MKVVTWNIDFKTDKSKLWDYVDKEINPDILLLQECGEYPSSYQGIGRRIGGARLWGSMVLSKKCSLEPIYLTNHIGWVAVNFDIKLLIFRQLSRRGYLSSFGFSRQFPRNWSRKRSSDQQSNYQKINSLMSKFTHSLLSP